ncbi:Uncharacterized membrane protein YfcA [Paracoccus isoporae]|uniref:Probable membrane transporter protein n=1 Tax=Paracoccus isoporae TaxID=591205 RepID=A0A1G6SYD7_9RHOB|nr:sulfite exporter TauE/SafE family protein [Paracoccus isoporae]SDD21247.1 Uncharacterized membrane protein YfcA [Paracoccus isoporae]
MTELILSALTLAVVGAVAGVLAGMLGIGGGIVLVPAFFYLFTAAGYGSADLMQICLATSLATIIVTSARSVMAHHRKGAVDWPILRDWAPGIAIGAGVGVLTVAGLRSESLQVIFACLVIVIALYMTFGRSTWRLAETMPQGPVKYGFAAMTGFFSVLLGIGGGSIGVPLMTLHGRPIHRAVATAAGFGGLIAVPSALLFLLTPTENAPPGTIGAINIPAFLIVIAVTLMTAPVGAALAHRLDPTRLKRIFALFLMVVALNMLQKSLF